MRRIKAIVNFKLGPIKEVKLRGTSKEVKLRGPNQQSPTFNLDAQENFFCSSSLRFPADTLSTMLTPN